MTGIAVWADQIQSSTAQPRFRTLLLSLFAAMALVLAATGILGVISSRFPAAPTKLHSRRVRRYAPRHPAHDPARNAHAGLRRPRGRSALCPDRRAPTQSHALRRLRGRSTHARVGHRRPSRGRRHRRLYPRPPATKSIRWSRSATSSYSDLSASVTSIRAARTAGNTEATTAAANKTNAEPTTGVSPGIFMSTK